jgi:hypothetical protein
MDHQFEEEHKTVPTFQVSLQRKSISGTYLISITSLPEDEQTSKHGGGGRYNAILEFKGEQIKKFMRTKKKKMRKIKKEKNMSMRKREEKKIYMSMYDIKIK